MKEFGVQLWSVRESFTTVEGTREAFKKLASFGYTQAQTAGTYDYIAPTEFRKFADEAGIAIVGTHYNWGKICDDVAGTIAYHRALGSDAIGIGGYPVNDMDSLKAFIRKFNEMADIYHKEGFVLTYHNHSSEFSNLFKKYEGKTEYDYLMEEFNPETTAFVLDSYWAHTAGIDLQDLIPKLKGRLNMVHLKDCEANVFYTLEDGRKIHVPERIEVGSGNMNFPGIIKAAEAAGCKYFVVEDEVYSTGVPMESVEKSAAYIKAHLLKK